MKKGFSKGITLLIIAAVFSVVAAAFALEGFKADKVKILTPEDIYVPDKMLDNTFGLYFYDDALRTVRSTEDNVPFDPAKPVVIFAHGMSMGYGIDSPEGFGQERIWLDAGYNVGVFVWSQLSDDDPSAGGKKVWGRSGLNYVYRDADTLEQKVETSDVPKYSMAETFAAYYYGFMTEQNFCGREIRFHGLSLGAQVITAAVSYLMTLEDAGAITKEFLPDRVTLFDAFFTNLSDTATYVDWLKAPIGKDGTARLGFETVKKMKAEGIAYEFVQSSPVSITAMLGDGDKNNLGRMTAEAVLLEYDSSWLGGLDVNSKHTIGRHWYHSMIAYPLPLDSAENVSAGQYAVSPRVPTSYAYARMGIKYKMGENYTVEPYDDVYLSQNIASPAVAGFCFEDSNGNGNYDERLVSRLAGIKVELYIIMNGEHKLIGRVTTDGRGAYAFPIEPIYLTASAGREFYVKVADTGKYGITASKGTEDFFLMANGINPDGKSDVFVIEKKGDLKIVNTGLRRA